MAMIEKFILKALRVACVAALVVVVGQHPAAAQDAPAPEPSSATDNSSYQIGVDDVLSISVWHEPDLSKNVPVRPDGKISMPLVGDLDAAGKTTTALEMELRNQLAKFIREPQVTVIVTDIRSRRINVMGQVNRPGAYPLTQSMGVLDALAQAGGLRDFAKKKEIYVLRLDNEGRRVRIPYAYKRVLRGSSNAQDLVLQPHDTVVVP